MEDYPVYQGPTFIGYMGEEFCRKLLRDRRAKLVRRGQERKIILNAETILSIKLLNTGHAGPALRSVQVEEVYTGHRKEQPVTVTGRVRTLMKFGLKTPCPSVVAGRALSEAEGTGVFHGFKPWSENDVFPPNRFNPDKIRHPLFAR